MKSNAALLYLIISFALIGAPFGMGRMMDGAHSTSLMTDHGQMGQMHHSKAPQHEPSTLHFVTCAACFATPIGDGLLTERLAVREIVRAMPATILHGKSLLPDLPPPRA